MSKETHTISADDDALREKVDDLIARREDFSIQADGSFRHREALLRWLRISKGERDERSFFRGLVDSVVTGDVVGCLGAAAHGAGYSWDYRQTDDAVTITFQRN